MRSLGRHRLMCGDSTNAEHVAALFDGHQADMVFTSPPYLEQRIYDGQTKHRWDDLMQACFRLLRTTTTGQVFVNLGLVHRKHQWTAYWQDWTTWMSEQGWLRLGWYVWDKMDGLPTSPGHGRLYSCHEFIFHFARKPVLPNKTVPCKHSGRLMPVVSMRGKDNLVRRPKAQGIYVQSHRIADTVTRVSNRGPRIEGQTAHFPIGLPASYIASFSQPGQIVHDPFCGSGTTIIACEREGRIGYGMEASPKYCQIAIDRFHREQDKQQRARPRAQAQMALR